MIPLCPVLIYSIANPSHPILSLAYPIQAPPASTHAPALCTLHLQRCILPLQRCTLLLQLCTLPRQLRSQVYAPTYPHVGTSPFFGCKVRLWGAPAAA